VSVAASERTFSLLRRVKNWLRGSMTQKHLSHLAVIATYSQRLSGYAVIKEPMREFGEKKTAERRSVFACCDWFTINCLPFRSN